jgi:hypothetical protein
LDTLLGAKSSDGTNVGLADKEIQEEIDTFMFEVIATEHCLITYQYNFLFSQRVTIRRLLPFPGSYTAWLPTLNVK